MGHPLHPLLIVFPAAFTVGAPVADVAGLLGDWPSVWTTGAYMSAAAVVTGLVAGVPGFIDYVYVVPPNSSGKKRATQHMVINLTALAALAAGWAFRDGTSLRPGAGTLVLEVAALGLVSYGGWLGGTLVYRNQIGVDHRYAGAGKWKEVDVSGGSGDLVVVASAAELQVNQMKLLRIGDRRIVLARADAGYFAFDDHCTHRGGSLAGGLLACNTVTCPWHGSQFDVTNGRVSSGPAKEQIKTYDVEQSGHDVRLRVP
jgi:nitrite reductase/ring-hydroxylating ferredoxin subunit/uncharacterized membrane protein